MSQGLFVRLFRSEQGKWNNLVNSAVPINTAVRNFHPGQGGSEDYTPSLPPWGGGIESSTANTPVAPGDILRLQAGAYAYFSVDSAAYQVQTSNHLEANIETLMVWPG
jgi:hypothetical protein